MVLVFAAGCRVAVVLREKKSCAAVGFSFGLLKSPLLVTAIIHHCKRSTTNLRDGNAGSWSKGV